MTCPAFFFAFPDLTSGPLSKLRSGYLILRVPFSGSCWRFLRVLGQEKTFFLWSLSLYRQGMAIGPSPPQGKQQKFRPLLMVFLAQKQSPFPLLSEPNLHDFRFKIVVFTVGVFFSKKQYNSGLPPNRGCQSQMKV